MNANPDIMNQITDLFNQNTNLKIHYDMKTKNFLAVVSLVFMLSCSKSTKPNYLFLNADQLIPLGIELNEKGLFYKNENPDWNQDNEKYACLAFYCTNDNYVSTKQFNITDAFTTTNGIDSLLEGMEFTKNDFYPLLIGDKKGIQSLDNETLQADMKLLPIAINMSQINLSNRKDTIIVWLRPTPSLKRALPSTINMDDYLRTIPEKI